MLLMFFHLRNTTELLEFIWEVSRNLIPIWWCKSCGTCAVFHLETHSCVGSDLFTASACFLLSTFGHEWFTFLSQYYSSPFFPLFSLPPLVCLFCILKPFRGFFLPFRNIFQLKWWNYSKLRLYHISACIFAKTLSEDFLLRPCVFILPLIPHTNVPLH